MASTLWFVTTQVTTHKTTTCQEKKVATPDPTSFPLGIWACKLNYKAIGGTSLLQTKQQSSQILKLLNLEDDGIKITTEEIVSRKVTETKAAALQHSLHNDSYYTFQEKVDALEECLKTEGIMAEVRPHFYKESDFDYTPYNVYDTH